MLQTNLGRARAAHDIVQIVAGEKDIDIVVISEPNVKIVRDNGFIMDNNENVAVILRNKFAGVRGYKKGSGYVCVEMSECSLYCCYCSPNCPLSEFKDFLDSVMQEVKGNRTEAIVLGDLNAKSAIWGSPVNDERGIYLAEWAAELDLVFMNDGIKPTFERGDQKSFIDITCSTRNVAKQISDWEVLDGEVLTYHHYIYFVIGTGKVREKEMKKTAVLFDKDKFTKTLRKNAMQQPINNLESLTELLKKVTKECTQIIRSNDRKLPYWWNIAIQEKRKECLHIRRKLTRCKMDKEEAEKQKLTELLKNERKVLRSLIRQSKREHWRQLCSELDADIWGEGYKIVMRRLGKAMPYALPLEQRRNIINSLFVQTEDDWVMGHEVEGDIPLITLEELHKTAERIKTKRAPGPDHLPPEAIKLAVTEIPQFFLKVFNDLLIRQEFPRAWKEASVVLIWKGKPINNASAFRPICLLSALGKLFEQLVKQRLELEIEEKGGISDFQYGFRKGRSTIHAVQAVVETVKSSREKWCVFVTLDIKNAFNSVSWALIVNKLEGRAISPYLINIIESYFSQRTLKVTNTETTKMMAGVPQGSILGPILCNLLYDGVLDLELTNGAVSLAYADDLAILIAADDIDELLFRVNESLRRIVVWMRAHSLEIAPQKTEVLVLKGPRKRDNVRFEIQNTVVTPKECVKYLGIWLDKKLLFNKHITQVIEKAEKRMSVLNRIMPNIGGPGSLKRTVLYGVIQSIVLYGAPIWQETLKKDKYANLLESLQRRALIRVACAYRTVSSRALQVITGIPPMTLLAEERSRIFKTGMGADPGIKKEERRVTLEKWQKMWTEHTATAAWTKKLIPDIIPWLNCKFRRLDYHFSQFLTGHGSYRVFTKRIQKTPDDLCIYCGNVDTVEHTIFDCMRWNVIRLELEMDIEQQLNANNIISNMICDIRKWNRIHRAIKEIMSSKEKEEREHRACCADGR